MPPIYGPQPVPDVLISFDNLTGICLLCPGGKNKGGLYRESFPNNNGYVEKLDDGTFKLRSLEDLEDCMIKTKGAVSSSPFKHDSGEMLGSVISDDEKRCREILGSFISGDEKRCREILKSSDLISLKSIFTICNKVIKSNTGNKMVANAQIKVLFMQLLPYLIEHYFDRLESEKTIIKLLNNMIIEACEYDRIDIVESVYTFNDDLILEALSAYKGDDTNLKMHNFWIMNHVGDKKTRSDAISIAKRRGNSDLERLITKHVPVDLH